MATGRVAQPTQQKVSLGQTVRSGLVGGAVAAVVSLGLYFLGNAVTGPITVSTAPGTPAAPLPWFLVLIMTLLAGVVGALLLVALRRYTANGDRIFQIVAVGFLLLSLLGPLTMAGSRASTLVLSALHIVTASAVIWALTLRRA